jgi:uncharacterized protein
LFVVAFNVRLLLFLVYFNTKQVIFICLTNLHFKNEIDLTRIGLISDTHGFLDEAVFEHFKNCNEIWHAGDFGLSLVPTPPRGEGGRGDKVGDKVKDVHIDKIEDRVSTVLDDKIGVWQEKYFSEKLNKKIIFRGVYGNIDNAAIRSIYPEKIFFTCEGVNVFIQHIGGYPGRYSKGVKEDIIANKSNLFISGHSHILKIMYDDTLQCLHMNPGAVGKQGWHKVRTLIRFTIDGKDMRDCEVVELGLKVQS